MPSCYCFPKVAKHNLGVDRSNRSTAVLSHSQRCMGDAKLCHRQELSCKSSLCNDKASKNRTPCRPVRLPLQPLAKPPLYTADRKRRTKSSAAVKPAGAPFHAPGPHTWPLSFLPREEGSVCSVGHAAYSGDRQIVPRGFWLRHTSQPPHRRPPAEPPPFGMAPRRCSKPQLSRQQLGHQSAEQSWPTAASNCVSG